MAEEVRRVSREARTAYSTEEIAEKAGLTHHYTSYLLRKLGREVIYTAREKCSVIVPDDVCLRGERRFYALRKNRKYLDNKIRELERKSRKYFKYVRERGRHIKNRVVRILPREDRQLFSHVWDLGLNRYLTERQRRAPR